VYFNPSLSQTEASVRQLWATATIRARPIGSSICNAVGSLGNHFQLACGHVAFCMMQTQEIFKPSYVFFAPYCKKSTFEFLIKKFVVKRLF
jgi:hypothetical protein